MQAFRTGIGKSALGARMGNGVGIYGFGLGTSLGLYGIVTGISMCVSVLGISLRGYGKRECC